METVTMNRLDTLPALEAKALAKAIKEQGGAGGASKVMYTYNKNTDTASIIMISSHGSL